MASLPNRNILDGSATPSTSSFQSAMGSLRDFLAGLLGADGTATTARTALNAAASGANSDITSLSALTGIYADSTNGLGYKAGAGVGGTVTQATSKSTAVTLNKLSGEIVMSNSALGAGSMVAFTVNNTFQGVNDLPFVKQVGWSNYSVDSYSNGPGSFNVRVTNISGGLLSDAVVLTFAILKTTKT